MNEQQRAALSEVGEKSLRELQIETAYTWAYRAWAAYVLAGRENSAQRFADAVEFAHEAVEHAALSEDAVVLSEVRLIIASGKRMF